MRYSISSNRYLLNTIILLCISPSIYSKIKFLIFKGGNSRFQIPTLLGLNLINLGFYTRIFFPENGCRRALFRVFFNMRDSHCYSSLFSCMNLALYVPVIFQKDSQIYVPDYARGGGVGTQMTVLRTCYTAFPITGTGTDTFCERNKNKDILFGSNEGQKLVGIIPCFQSDQCTYKKHFLNMQ